MLNFAAPTTTKEKVFIALTPENAIKIIFTVPHQG
jgi:hypothetical protein